MYQREAQGLASLGRGPDTELVHMTQGEVGALDNLARRTGFEGLPVNPQTGLPEAGIMSNILPMLIGAGAAIAAPFTGGGSLAAFLASPLAVGGASALGAGIASGWDPAQMAKWGLGVGGGAQLGGQLATAGGAAGAGIAAPAVPAAEAVGGAGFAKGSLGAQHAAGKLLRDTAVSGQGGFWGNIGSEASKQVGREQAKHMLKGIVSPKNLFGVAGKAGTGALTKTPFLAGMGSVAASEYGKEPEPFDPIVKKREYDYPEGGFFPPPRTSINPFAGEQFASDTGEETYFEPEVFTSPGYIPAKGGGLMGLKQYEEGGEVSAPSISVPTPDAGEASYFTPSRAASFTPPAVNPQLAAAYSIAPQLRAFHEGTWHPLMPGYRPPAGMTSSAPAFTPRTRNYAESAPFNYGQPDTGELSYFNQGGLTRGPGDGMSDDIILPINGSKDRAAVSPDEFVVSADVVSGLGNGSTSAGAKQLYSMMDRVRNTRTGRKSQPREINPDRMLPA